MTRLDANGEPSMEEILASIRRIIAEEPPGSRAVAPQARPSLQTPSDSMASDRSSFARDPSSMVSSTKPDFMARHDARSSSDLSGGRADAMRSSSQAEVAPSPSGASNSSPFERRDREIEPSRPAESVQAQLSDLLDTGDTSEAAPSHAALRPQSIRLENFEPADARSETRRESSPRFTVSRDGYVGAETADADPFDFDLGPSPFSKRTAGASSKPDAPTEDDFEEALGGPAPEMKETPRAEVRPARLQDAPRVDQSAASEFASSVRREAPREAKPEPSPAPRAEPVRQEFSNDAHRRAPLEETVAYRPSVSAAPSASSPSVDHRAVSPSASPSIAATLPPERPSTRMDSSSFAKSVDMMSSRSGRDSMQDVVTEAVNAAMSRPPRYSAVEMGDKPVPVEVDDALSPSQQVAVRESGAAGSAGLPAVRHGETGIRSMEDTVADLLRPMLKVWLAENMPKIIERALRREISEMSLPGQQHKTAAE